jgi:hypothetical protein
MVQVGFIQWDADEMRKTAFISLQRTLSMSPMFCTPVEAQFQVCQAGPRQHTDLRTGGRVRVLVRQMAHLADLLVDSGLLQLAESPNGSNLSVCCNLFGDDLHHLLDLFEVGLDLSQFLVGHLPDP